MNPQHFLILKKVNFKELPVITRNIEYLSILCCLLLILLYLLFLLIFNYFELTVLESI